MAAVAAAMASRAAFVVGSPELDAAPIDGLPLGASTPGSAQNTNSVSTASICADGCTRNADVAREMVRWPREIPKKSTISRVHFRHFSCNVSISRAMEDAVAACDTSSWAPALAEFVTTLSNADDGDEFALECSTKVGMAHSCAEGDTGAEILAAEFVAATLTRVSTEEWKVTCPACPELSMQMLASRDDLSDVLLQRLDLGYYRQPPAVSEPDPSPFEQFWVLGNRFQMAYGMPPVLEGGMIDSLDESNKEDGHWLVFDDGDLKFYSTEEAKTFFDSTELQPLSTSIGGLVKGTPGLPMAVGLVRHKFSSNLTSVRPVGTLVGDTGKKVFGVRSFLEFHVQSAQFDAYGDCVATRKKAGVEKETLQDRNGFHTFRHGDVVAWKKGDDGETAEAIVFSVHHWAKGEKKLLLLWEKASATFFPALWPHWRRVCADAHGEWEEDNPAMEHRALTGTPEDVEVMQTAWEAGKDDALRDAGTVAAINAAQNRLPPSIRKTRNEAARVQGESDRVAKRKQEAVEAKERRQELEAKKKVRLAEKEAETQVKKAQKKVQQAQEAAEKEVALLIKKRQQAQDEAQEIDGRGMGGGGMGGLGGGMGGIGGRGMAGRGMAGGGMGGGGTGGVGSPLFGSPAFGQPLQPTHTPHATPPQPATSQLMGKPLTLPAGWKSAFAADGQAYYYNKLENRSTYEKPMIPESPPLPPPPDPSPRAERCAVTLRFSADPLREQLQDNLAMLEGRVVYLQGTERADTAGEIGRLKSKLARHP